MGSREEREAKCEEGTNCGRATMLCRLCGRTPLPVGIRGVFGCGGDEEPSVPVGSREKRESERKEKSRKVISIVGVDKNKNKNDVHK